MKKWIGLLLGIAALCAFVATIFMLVKNGGCPCSEKVKTFFTERDFTVLPMDQEYEEV